MNRGALTIEVLHGLPEVLDTLGAEFVTHADGTLAAYDELNQRWLAQAEAGTLHLVDVTGTAEIAEVLARAGGATWQAWCDERTEAPNLWMAHHPGVGAVEGTWLDGQVVVPISWVEAGTRTGAEERWLERYRTVARMLGDPAAMRTQPVALSWHAGFGHPPNSEELAEYAQAGLDPHCTASYQLAFLPTDPHAACEALFEATNLNRGSLWEQLSAQGLPPTRGHTALSVGDEVHLDGHTWRCAPVGWTDTGPTVAGGPDTGPDPLALDAGDPLGDPQTRGPQATR